MVVACAAIQFLWGGDSLGGLIGILPGDYSDDSKGAGLETCLFVRTRGIANIAVGSDGADWMHDVSGFVV